MSKAYRVFREGGVEMVTSDGSTQRWGPGEYEQMEKAVAEARRALRIANGSSEEWADVPEDD